MAKTLIPQVRSLGELHNLAANDPRYRRLAMLAAENLGASPKDLAAAMRWLNLNADETDSEKGVIAEVNFCRDLV